MKDETDKSLRSVSSFILHPSSFPRPGVVVMEPSQDRQETRRRLFVALAEAVMPLKGGPDPEVTLELLIEAVASLREHLEQELAELRQEQAE
jgi:hypothetical protein